MKHAIEALRNKKMGLKKACKEFNVPRTTLQRRYKSTVESTAAAAKKLGSRRNVFDMEMENELVQHVKDMENMLLRFHPKAPAKTCLRAGKGKQHSSKI